MPRTSKALIRFPASILYKSIAGRYRPVSYPDGPRTARYRFIKNAYWVRRIQHYLIQVFACFDIYFTAFANSNDSDEPAKLHYLKRVFTVFDISDFRFHFHPNADTFSPYLQKDGYDT